MSDQQDHSTADKIADAVGNAAESVRKAIEEGIAAVRPTWEEKVVPKWEQTVVPAWEDKVAPAIASGADKVAEWSQDVREAADKKSAELSAHDSRSDKFLGGALGVGAAAAALSTSAAKWVSKEAGQVGHHDGTEGGAPAASAAPTEAAPTGAAPTATTTDAPPQAADGD